MMLAFLVERGFLYFLLILNLCADKFIGLTGFSREIKACVRYFLTNFYFSPNDSTSKTMQDVFYLKSTFRSWDIQIFPMSHCFRAWSKKNLKVYYVIISMWRRGVVVITTAQLHSTKPELRFCAGSNLPRGVSEIRDGEDLWQWSRLELRLNAFRRSTISQKQLIIIIIIIIIIINCLN